MAFERLPLDVVPVHYALNISPDVEAATFVGNVRVALEARASATRLMLNARKLKIHSAKVTNAASGAEVPVANFTFLDDRELLVVTLAEPGLAKGDRAELFLEFEGELNNRMRGFYRVMQADGGPAASCHFEATGAREAFPCWDEPSFRATFDVSITVKNPAQSDPHRVVLFNMPEISRSEANGETTHVFATTPSMPTYLLCWCVGRFDNISTTADDGTSVRVFAPPAKVKDCKMALDVAVKALGYYKDFFGVAYGLPKMDIVCIEDFPIGAMENWGLLTFKENYVLFDEKDGSVVNKQNVALIVAHEVAHQWFGNFVTISWWTHLWLKEGYATWIEYLCQDHIYPEWKIWTQFLVDVTLPALELDSLESSHPIEVKVKDPAQIEEIFDTISYNKGASIIRMLFTWIGEESFRRGMNTYLNAHQFGCASTEDLWKALGDASGKPVDKVMSSWTLFMGYPVLSVEKIQYNDEDGSATLSLRQERFLLSPSTAAVESTRLWSIPLSVTSKSSNGAVIYSALMSSEAETHTIPGVKRGEWINLNPEGSGYFRVRYNHELMQELLSAVASLPVSTRLSMLTDQLALVKSGRASVVDLLRLLEKFSDEPDIAVWDAITHCLYELRLMLRGGLDPAHAALQAFNSWVIDLVKPAWTKVGWQPKSGESHFVTLLRSLLLRVLVTSGDEQVLDEAAAKFNETVSSDLRSSVYRAAMKRNGEEAFSELVSRAGAATDLSEKLRLYESMGAAPTEQLLRKVLEFGMSESVRFQDTINVVGGVAVGSRMGRDLAWQFFVERSEEFGKRYAAGGLLTRLVRSVTFSFATEAEARAVEDFFVDGKHPGAARTVKQTLEVIRLRSSWIDRDLKKAADYLLLVKQDA